MPDHVVLETYNFEEVDGRTTVTTQSIFQSEDDRDGMLASGMVDGSDDTTDRLGGLVIRLVAA